MLKTFLNAVTDRDRQTPLIFVDFGAGDAHISRTSKAALRDKVDIYCIEEMAQCEPLYSKYGLTLLAGIEDLPGKADLIYAIETIEHVVNPVAVFKELASVLASNGKVFLSTPPGHVDERRTNAYENATHLHFFTPLSLNGALAKAGLDPIEYRFFPEMYPSPAHQEGRGRVRAMMPTLRARVTSALKVARSSTPVDPDPVTSMGMPRSSDGAEYPYHLVGFTQSRVGSRHSRGE